jgi:hypothetical protein
LLPHVNFADVLDGIPAKPHQASNILNGHNPALLTNRQHEPLRIIGVGGCGADETRVFCAHELKAILNGKNITIETINGKPLIHYLSNMYTAFCEAIKSLPQHASSSWSGIMQERQVEVEFNKLLLLPIGALG